MKQQSKDRPEWASPLQALLEQEARGPQVADRWQGGWGRLRQMNWDLLAGTWPPGATAIHLMTPGDVPVATSNSLAIGY